MFAQKLEEPREAAVGELDQRKGGISGAIWCNVFSDHVLPEPLCLLELLPPLELSEEQFVYVHIGQDSGKTHLMIVVERFCDVPVLAVRLDEVEVERRREEHSGAVQIDHHTRDVVRLAASCPAPEKRLEIAHTGHEVFRAPCSLQS